MTNYQETLREIDQLPNASFIETISLDVHRTPFEHDAETKRNVNIYRLNLVNFEYLESNRLQKTRS